MLEALPWPKHLMKVPEYAGGHHERMDGKGYPRGLTRDQMSVQARVMGIADYFEALTARIGPTKRARRCRNRCRFSASSSSAAHRPGSLRRVHVGEGLSHLRRAVHGPATRSMNSIRRRFPVTCHRPRNSDRCGVARRRGGGLRPGDIDDQAFGREFDELLAVTPVPQAPSERYCQGAPSYRPKFVLLLEVDGAVKGVLEYGRQAFCEMRRSPPLSSAADSAWRVPARGFSRTRRFAFPIPIRITPSLASRLDYRFGTDATSIARRPTIMVQQILRLPT